VFNPGRGKNKLDFTSICESETCNLRIYVTVGDVVSQKIRCDFGGVEDGNVITLGHVKCKHEIGPLCAHHAWHFTIPPNCRFDACKGFAKENGDAEKYYYTGCNAR